MVKLNKFVVWALFTLLIVFNVNGLDDKYSSKGIESLSTIDSKYVSNTIDTGINLEVTNINNVINTSVNASINGMDDYIPKINGTQLINSLIYDTGVGIGINDTVISSNNILEVNGNVRFDGDGLGINANVGNFDMVINTLRSQPVIELRKSGTVTGQFGTTASGNHFFFDAEQTNSDIYFRTKTNQVRLAIDGSNGYVGVGSATSLPSKFYVNSDNAVDEIMIIRGAVGQSDNYIELQASDTSVLSVFDSEGRLILNDDSINAVYPAKLTINKPSTDSGDFILFETNSSGQDVDGFTFYQTGGVQFQGIKMLKYVAQNNASEDVQLMTLTCTNYDETDGTEDTQCLLRAMKNGVSEQYQAWVAGRNIFYQDTYWDTSLLYVDMVRDEIRVGSHFTNEDATFHIQGHSTTQAVLQLEGETGQSDPILRVGNDTMDNVVMEVYADGRGFIEENIYYDVTSWTNVSPISGGTTELSACLDEQWFNVSENTGSPAMTTNFTFTNVDTFRNIVICQEYTGNHDLHMRIYNNNLNKFVDLNDMGNTDSINCNYKSIGGPSDNFVDGSGNVLIQIDHPQNGVNTHKEYVDCLRLER